MARLIRPSWALLLALITACLALAARADVGVNDAKHIIGEESGGGAMQRQHKEFQDECRALSGDCIACARHPSGDCGYCADGSYYGDNEEIAPGSHIGGWIFRQKGLQTAEETATTEEALEQHHEDSALETLQKASSLLARIEAVAKESEMGLSDASAVSSAERKMGAREAEERTTTRALLLEMEGKIEAAREALKQGASNQDSEQSVEQDEHELSSVLLELSSHSSRLEKTHNGAAADGHKAASKGKAAKGRLHHRRHQRHLFGCYNRTAAVLIHPSPSSSSSLAASLPRYSIPGAGPKGKNGICIDFRTDACDCEGAEQRLPETCALAVAEVKTPGVLVFAAFGAAALVVSGLVVVQFSFSRDSCQRGRSGKGSKGSKSIKTVEVLETIATVKTTNTTTITAAASTVDQEQLQQQAATTMAASSS